MGDPDVTPTRMRTKKKSTLAKLKERKLREQGSLTSLQSYQGTGSSNASENVSPETSPLHKQPQHEGTVINGGNRTFSTKDPPKPRPRRSSRQASTGSHTDLSKFDSREQTELDPTSNLHTQDHKVIKPYGDSVDSNIGNSGFVPKPPLTPRSQNSNPRTPRGFVTPPNRGETHNQCHPSVKDTEHSKIRDGLDEDVTIKTGTAGGVGALLSSLGDNNNVNNDNTSPSRKLLGQIKPGERLLKRRGSRDSGEIKPGTTDLSTLNGGLSKPPAGNGINHTHNTNNNSNRNKVGSLLQSSSAAVPQSPRRFLKSDRQSQSNQGEEGDSIRHNGTSSSFSALKDLHVSIPTELASKQDPQYPDPSQSNKDSPEHVNKARNNSSPATSARLNPISPRPNPPPPLDESLASHGLRTSFKVDPNVRPPTGSAKTAEKSDSGGATSNGDRVSQQSFTSVSVLPVITTKEARTRSYLEGSIGTGTPSILGAEELDRYFPTRKVNVLVGTWNMNEQKEISYPLDDLVLPERCDYVQDIYAFGTQENDVNKKEWEVKIQETLGPSHVMLHSVSLGSLHLVVFIRRDLIWFCSLPEDDVLSLRAVTMVKTKGAIGISLSLFGTSYLFINCHLTSDRDNDNTRKKNRLGDYFKVIQDMKLPKSSQLLSSTKKTSDITAIFDCVFWFGDLNFRIERKRHAVEGKVSQITEEEFPNFEALLGGDQLLKYMTEGKIFHGFQEGRINFHPTFKFDINKDTYDSSQKNRVPSYTDRIMFRSKRKNDISCVCYDAVMSIKHSDHKPVFGQFETVVRAGADNTVYAAGHFDRSVYMEANKRRAAQLPTKKKSNSKVCTIQ